MTAESRPTITVGPGLSFAFRGLPAALWRRAERFLGHSARPGPATGADPVVLTTDPPEEALLEARVVLDLPSLLVREREGTVLFETAGVLAWCDTRTGEAGIALDDPTDAELDHFAGFTLGPLLVEAAASRGWFGIHAAAVSVGGAGILLTGPSGCGKSTIFASMHRAGHGVLSDDLVWLRPTGDGVRLHALPRGPYGNPAPGPTADDVPLRAIVCPEIAGRDDSRLLPAEVPELVPTLLEQSGLLASGESLGGRFQALVRVARAVPAYRLEAGRRREDVPPLLSRLAMRPGLQSARNSPSTRRTRCSPLPAADPRYPTSRR